MVCLLLLRSLVGGSAMTKGEPHRQNRQTHRHMRVKSTDGTPSGFCFITSPQLLK
ncbi:hypothetical protein PF005_g16399 [Phytophthora fragariae]|uniref:Secreted protein n=1 Tax=Phytophthora fragariae TaxID=53985 RepID=A0A6A3GL80_9STRA|nr:hypothetical protein PF003_g37566 [Phytophthora fragariae]KAE8957197.1 hypothetical protein PF011_g31224 [Phytophthora fragariae]KAE9056561.1 hypothetical protein PF010_g31720 [Phytophthora fragariae]KAE9098028.1 hypothetical protein PF007_g16413 [Phytophthora fragariae]KAE9197739.1 hypothetical protein PF005_g16399 [Phytophthora fragariae]